MRRIVYLKGGSGIADCGEFLDLCSQYTPLIEPREDKALYLDLSGCGDLYAILGEIGDFSNHSLPECLQAGVATSRLVARLAVEHRQLCSRPKTPKACYKILSRPGIQLIEVLPGCEKEFMNPLPLGALELLSAQQLKKISRMGFSTIGELGALSYPQLSQIIAKDPYLTRQVLNGMDTSPVTGLYPPSRLSYPIELEGDLDLIRLEGMLRDATLMLEGLLEERQAGCSHLKVEVKRGGRSIIKERQLSRPCYRAGQLFNIIWGLLAKGVLVEGLSGILITLQDIAGLSFSQPDLFSLRVCPDGTQRKGNIETLLEGLQNRYPDSLQYGLKVSRREQVLALWDPWRQSENL